jgi:hypothetical protein
MQDLVTYQLGLDGFIWWVGVIESLTDPLKIGRAKVRIIGWHDVSTEKLATIDLPWAYPVCPVTHASTPPNFRHGDWVVGFFLDGKLGQQPIIFGVLPGLPQK